MISIRKSTNTELETILDVELDAFGGDPEIRTLVTDLLNDESAKPLISLLAFEGNTAVGHVYFTRAKIENSKRDASTMILAPLAVRKSHQKTGIGQQLVHRAIEEAKQQGVEVVFVLGHPTYYPRCGFAPAGRQGFEAPYPILKKDADAWMVIELKAGALKEIGSGKVRCADTMMKPEYWRE